MNSLPHFPGVYLIHMDSPVLRAHAQHYIGWSTDVFERLFQHRRNRALASWKCATSAASGYKIARVWKGQNRSFERKLKNRKNARRLCPVCSGQAARKLPMARAPKAFCT
jgi:predicted GIY-YIG superfamily endonuclease